jgi:hypothetical protein
LKFVTKYCCSSGVRELKSNVVAEDSVGFVVGFAELFGFTVLVEVEFVRFAEYTPFVVILIVAFVVGLIVAFVAKFGAEFFVKFVVEVVGFIVEVVEVVEVVGFIASSGVEVVGSRV